MFLSFLVIVSIFQNYSLAAVTPDITVDEVDFFLYTRENPIDGEILEIDDSELLRNSSFNLDWPIRIIIHGYENSKDSYLNTKLRDEYLKKSHFNIIVVDWSYYSHSLYMIAMSQVNPLGIIVAKLTEFLNREGADFDNMYLIGHSLGAHIAGVAGYNIAPNQYNTIFALDPARPGFEFVSLDQKIDSTDARYVESIQTDPLLVGVGMMVPVGFASFFPNRWSLIQPGCVQIGCSHLRSITYLAESINSHTGFLAKVCKTCSTYVRMGGEPSEFKWGVYELSTNSESPFAKGVKGA